MMMRAALILAGIGTLAVMEIQTPPRAKSVVSDPLPLSIERSESNRTLSKEDRLEFFSAKPVQPVSSSEGVISPSVAAIVSKQSPDILSQLKRVANEKKGVALRTKLRPKLLKPKAFAKTNRPKVFVESKSCRPKAFNGLLIALDLPCGCET
jgi:hypothetical protein